MSIRASCNINNFILSYGEFTPVGFYTDRPSRYNRNISYEKINLGLNGFLGKEIVAYKFDLKAMATGETDYYMSNPPDITIHSKSKEQHEERFKRLREHMAAEGFDIEFMDRTFLTQLGKSKNKPTYGALSVTLSPRLKRDAKKLGCEFRTSEMAYDKKLYFTVSGVVPKEPPMSEVITYIANKHNCKHISTRRNKERQVVSLENINDDCIADLKLMVDDVRITLVVNNGKEYIKSKLLEAVLEIYSD